MLFFDICTWGKGYIAILLVNMITFRISAFSSLVFVLISSCCYSQICFSPASNLAAGNNPIDIVAADFNNDTKADLVITNGSSIFIFLGTGTGGFGAALSGPASGAYPIEIITAVAIMSTLSLPAFIAAVRASVTFSNVALS